MGKEMREIGLWGSHFGRFVVLQTSSVYEGIAHLV